MDTKEKKGFYYLIGGMVAFLTVTKVYELLKNYRKAPRSIQSTSSDNKRYIPNELKPKKELSIIKKPNIHKIVFTGGPCAGKTTALALVADRLRERGYRVLCVPECATIVFSSGVSIDITKMTMQENLKLHSSLIQYIINQEDRFMEFASISDAPTVVLCDRGALDVKAYMAPDAWQALLDEMGWNTVEIRDKRYDGIIHLVTAADGASEYYNQANAARYESQIEVAISTDKRLREAWIGHPQYFLIDNYSCKTFDEKMERTYQAVLRLIGLEKPPRVFNKFLLKKTEQNDDGTPKLPSDLEVEVFTIEDIFLESTDKTYATRIRKRGQKGSYFYQLYSKTQKAGSVDREDIVEVKKQINAREYLALYARRDTSKKPVKKIRQCFFLQGQFCFIDTFLSVPNPFSVFSVNREFDVNQLILPKNIQIEKEITQNKKQYSSFELASEN